MMQQHASLCRLSSEALGEFCLPRHRFCPDNAVTRYRAGSPRELSALRGLNRV